MLWLGSAVYWSRMHGNGDQAYNQDSSTFSIHILIAFHIYNIIACGANANLNFFLVEKCYPFVGAWTQVQASLHAAPRISLFNLLTNVVAHCSVHLALQIKMVFLGLHNWLHLERFRALLACPACCSRCYHVSESPRQYLWFVSLLDARTTYAIALGCSK